MEKLPGIPPLFQWMNNIPARVPQHRDTEAVLHQEEKVEVRLASVVLDAARDNDPIGRFTG